MSPWSVGQINFGGSAPLELTGITDGSTLSIATGSPRCWLKNGDYIYVVFGSTLYSVDVSSPLSPSLADSISITHSPALYMAVNGSYLYLTVYGSTDSTTYLKSVDISDPTNMSVADSWGGTAFSFFNRAIYITFVGTYAVVLGLGFPTCRIFDITDPTNLTIESNQPDSIYGDSFRYHRVGDYVLSVADVASGIASLDVVTSIPALTYADELPNGIPDRTDLLYDNGVMYTIGNNNVHSYDVSDPTNLAFLHSVATLGLEGFQTVSIGMYKQLAIVGDVLAASMIRDTGTGDGVAYIDVSDPSAMSIESTRTGATTGPYNMQGHMGKLFVCNTSEIEMLDVSNPASVSLVDSTSIPSFGWGLILEGLYGWVMGSGDLKSIQLDT